MIQQTFDIPSATPPAPPPVATHPVAIPVEIDLLTPDEPLVRKMMATYSADVIAYGNRARGFIEHSGRLWVCTSHGGMQAVDLTEVHPGHIDIPRTPNNPRLYYADWKITIKGRPFTLGATKLHVRYKPPEEAPDAICVIDKCTVTYSPALAGELLGLRSPQRDTLTPWRSVRAHGSRYYERHSRRDQE